MNRARLRLVSYFTIQSNIAVAIVSGILLRRPDADGRGFGCWLLFALAALADRRLPAAPTGPSPRP